MSDGEVVMSRKIEEFAPRMMGKIVLSFMVLNKPVKIHIEFKEPLPISEMPRTVLESEEPLLEELEAQIWVNKKDKIEMIDRVSVQDDRFEEEDEGGDE